MVMSATFSEIIKSMVLSKGQKQALDDLLPIAEIALEVDKSELPIRPRTHSLICAPSGSGKSYLMKALGDILDVPILHLNCSSWAPLGGKSEKTTWSSIVEFISAHSKGIIVLDEIDKITSTNTDWLGHIRLEIYDLLDGRIPKSIEIEEESSELW